MTNSEIAAIILPWAKAQHPEKYADTLKVAANERTFRRYMIRLIEIRWTEDTDRTWRNEISMLMEQPDPSAAIGQLVMVKRTLDLESAE
jgi:hypothetical protein